MAGNSWNHDVGCKGQFNEYKSCFETQEGIYKLIYSTDLFSREKESTNVNTVSTNTPVMLSFLNRKKLHDSGEIESFDEAQTDIMCVNFGKELFIYPFDNYNINQENISPLDKRLYKCTFPTCHDFNANPLRSPSILLIVGFTGGQIQLIDPIKKDNCKLFNEERHIDKTAVTCIKWVPTTSNQFLVSHASGFVYLYNENLPCGAMPPVYQTFKQGIKYCVSTCKTKSTRNPLYRWEFESPEKEQSALEKSLSNSNSGGSGGSLSPAVSSLLSSSKYCSVNNFAFSPSGQWLGLAGQDGFLRVFDYHKMELQGCMRSYFGGINCLDWSADERFIVVGGQDDLVTVWSVEARAVVCRGQGHKSWVSTVRFDLGLCPTPNQPSPTASTDGDNQPNIEEDNRTRNMLKAPTYRFGSVGQDTLLCLWELTDDVVRQALKFASSSSATSTRSETGPIPEDQKEPLPGPLLPTATSSSSSTLPKMRSRSVLTKAAGGSSSQSNNQASSLSQKFVNSLGGIWGTSSSSAGATGNLPPTVSSSLFPATGAPPSSEKKHFTFGSASNTLRSSSKTPDCKLNGLSVAEAHKRFLGTSQCPRLEDIPILEPIVSKHVSNDRLTDLVFREESLLCTCQQGTMYAWTRPGYSVMKTILNAVDDNQSISLNSLCQNQIGSHAPASSNSNPRNSSLKMNRTLSRDVTGTAI